MTKTGHQKTSMATDQPARTLQRALDLKRSGIESIRRGVPIALLVSSTECSYCERLKAEVFRPMLKHKPDAEKVALFELLIDVDDEVNDFDGNLRTGHAVAESYDATLTPTVLFLAPDGTELAERMIGVLNYDFYPWYFDQRIEIATERLRHVINN